MLWATLFCDFKGLNSVKQLPAVLSCDVSVLFVFVCALRLQGMGTCGRHSGCTGKIEGSCQAMQESISGKLRIVCMNFFADRLASRLEETL